MIVTDLSRIFILIGLFDSLKPFMSHPSPLPSQRADKGELFLARR